MQLSFDNERQTERFAMIFAQALVPDLSIYLYGELGAGKTTFVRKALQALGVQGSVKSPTYTLMEPYALPDAMAYHLDLYRISDEAELEYLGLEDCFAKEALCFIEWPERGGTMLPMPDLKCYLSYSQESDTARAMTLSAHTKKGEGILQHIQQAWSP